MPDIDPMLEKHEPEMEADAETDVVMQSYPSPNADGQDNGSFYHTNPQQDQQPQLGLDQQHEHQGQLEDPSTPSQQLRPNYSSAEELQLAAQLSQGIAHGIPMMDPNEDPNLQHVMAQHNLQHEQELQHHEHQLNHHHDQLHHDGLPQSHDGLPSQSEHDGIHEHVHEHDQPIPEETDEHMQHHDQQQQGQHEQQSQHQYLSDQQQQQPHQPHLQPAAPLDHLGSQFQLPDNTPPRKRSKVSRACDECRRKKVKCDAPSETGEEACSNCRRGNSRCLFSRIPQKRGPSKGYIKELADRINHIEGKLASEGGNTDTLSELLASARRESHDMFQPGQSDGNGRKRPYSSISGNEFGTPSSSRQPTYSSEPRPIQPYQTPTDRFRPQYSANGLAPAPVATKPDSGTSSRPEAVMDGVSLDLEHIDQAREVDETAFAAYLTVVHPCYPVLASNKSRLEAQLIQCMPVLRDAFIEALHGTVQSFPSFNGTYGNDLASAARLIAEWETDLSPRSHVVNLIHLQTLILMAISADNHGPASLRGEHGGAAKSNMLGRAVGLAYSMRLHLSQVDMNLNAEFDFDSDENVAIRAWWTLVMLDRWNAISTASPLLIPNDSVVILPSLNYILGEHGYHLARLSNILGHFAPVALAPPKAMTHESGVAPILGSFFNLSMELFREVLPANITPATHPILHFVYWHCRLLAYLFQPNARPGDILWPCRETANLLTANSQLLSPLNHHFFCLTALTLLELTKLEALREEATLHLRELLDSNVAPSSWDGTIRDRISEQIRPTTAQTSMASQSLQHLADLATATELDGAAKSSEAGLLRASDIYEEVAFDPRALTRKGYLNAIAESRPSTAR
ncbi:hypothetical protein BJ170DRAFT_270390 [Xylariales sp. AK1849]|nr:hypothetical protein BJ170DRAFT_270390 [Xylariales sp. AK1849]